MVMTILPVSPVSLTACLLNILELEKDAVLCDVDPVFVFAFETGAAHLVGTVEVVNVAAPELFELLAQRIVRIRTKKAVN